MQIAIINNDEIVEIGDTSTLFPNISFPSTGPSINFLLENSAMPLIVWEPFDGTVEKLERVEPYINDNKVYTCRIVKKTESELASESIRAQKALIDHIIHQTQMKLDDFAKIRNYDNIQSACTYASSSISKFKEEGQRCIDLRDQTWSTLYTILDDVNSGVTPFPTSFDDIQPLLPELSW
jgi:hypothetical protein